MASAARPGTSDASNGISKPQNPQPTRNPECDGRGDERQPARDGPARLIFGIELREFFFADVFNVLVHVAPLAF
jgi:hypothetical protein